MFHAYILLYFCIWVNGALDFSGRWVGDGWSTGVYELYPQGSNLYQVISLTPVLDVWKNGQLTVINDTTVQINVAGSIVYGSLEAEGTRIYWATKFNPWHKFGLYVQCPSAPTFNSVKYDKFREVNLPVYGDIETKSIGGTDPADVVKVHVVITTHFDLGFTDYGYCIIMNYFWYIYPGIVATSLAMPDFKYSTQPWLLYLYFHCDELKPFMKPPNGIQFVCPVPQMKQDLKQAITRGQIVFHSFPFDGFNEMLGATLFNYSFDITSALAQELGVQLPRTMAQVDVPGLYQAQLNTLVRRGVRGIYIGQNPDPMFSGAVSQLPNLYRWASPDLTGDLVVMTHKLGYGGLRTVDAVVDPVTNVAMVVRCVLENSVPYTPLDVFNILGQVQRNFPNAEVVISSYDDFLSQVLPHKNDLPIFRSDMGDTWVRASASDPVKTANFMSLRRGFEDCVARGQCPHSDAINQFVMFAMTACEHNFGMPIGWRGMESGIVSFKEKRDFLDVAFKIAQNKHPLLYKALEEDKLKRSQPLPVNPIVPAPANDTFRCGVVTVTFGPNGAITGLSDGITNLAGPLNPLALVQYTVHDILGGDMPPTAGGDPIPRYLNFSSIPVMQSASQSKTDDLCTFSSISQLSQGGEKQGSPPPINVTVSITVNSESLAHSQIQVSFKGIRLSYWNLQTWAQKVQIGAAMSLQFNPTINPSNQAWSVSVLNVTYSPNNFEKNGTNFYHVADSTSVNGFTLKFIDSLFLMFGNASSASLSGRDYTKPLDFSSGAWANLWNSWNGYWVTAFPWIENDSDISFRFAIDWNKR